MNQLAIFPACSSGNRRHRPSCAVTIDFREGQSETFALRLIDSELIVAEDDEADIGTASNSADHIALLRHQPIDGADEWFVLDSAGRFAINDHTPLLGIQRLAAGDLLSCGEQSWFITRRFTPTPKDAPASIRDKLCPTCGDKLGAAPVVQCGCGRFLHLEHPEEPDDASALNCFLVASTCGGCGRPTSMQPQLFPELPASIAGDEQDDLDAILIV